MHTPTLCPSSSALGPSRSHGRHGEWLLAILAIVCMQGLLLLELLRG